MDFPSVLAAAKRAQAAYVMNPAQSKKAFEALGHTWLGIYQNDSHQAIVSRDPVGVYLSISGTRFSNGKLADLFDDIDNDPIDVGGGALVTQGAYEGLDKVWAWARGLVPTGTVWNVCGHSLGGWRTRYTPLFLAPHEIGDLHSFESPKGGNAKLWEKIGPQLSSLVSVVNGRDLFVSFPFLGDWSHPPRDTIWLKSTGFQVIQPNQFPGGRLISDHSIDLVVNRLQAIVGSGVPI